MIWHRPIAVEFNHCDPAGIVFYPRYFEMTNSVIENFFADVIDYPYARITMEERHGVPTVHIEADFRAPARLGDRLDFALEIRRLGRSSVTFHLAATARDILRMEATLTLAWITPAGRAAPWPDAIRSRLAAFMETDA
ncbi:MAG: acyl-CoA thioesterase [Paracoccaceae bacterium]|nr:acyl-CoA thioesterase [Paracoccaceae bacterium]MDE3121819.1 acyl-CoA thioesterase [Paracoccaceae bacterium]